MKAGMVRRRCCEHNQEKGHGTLWVLILFVCSSRSRERWRRTTGLTTSKPGTPTCPCTSLCPLPSPPYVKNPLITSRLLHLQCLGALPILPPPDVALAQTDPVYRARKSPPRPRRVHHPHGTWVFRGSGDEASDDRVFDGGFAGGSFGVDL